MPTEVDSEWLWQLSESCRDDLLDKGIEKGESEKCSRDRGSDVCVLWIGNGVFARAVTRLFVIIGDCSYIGSNIGMGKRISCYCE